MCGGASLESRVADADFREPGDLADHLPAVFHFKPHERNVQVQYARVREPLHCPGILGEPHESEKIRIENMRPAREKLHSLARQSFGVHREPPRPARAGGLIQIGLKRQ